MALSKLDHGSELASERARIALMYSWLDGERTQAAGALASALADGSDPDPEARWHRQVVVDALSERVNRSRIADSGLCVGRLDTTDGERTYIGRLGLFDADNDYEPLLIDWRAPAARPFYCATGANPEGVRVRRHFHTRGRDIVDFQDDVFDTRYNGESTLLAAVNAPRAESMRDIVATIQAEQDDIIRLDHDGVLVIEGGPGTGKTAVALHRVAYLLYTRRARLSRSGVLVIGPNPGFLRYVDQVLPSLGETDVVFATVGDLLPGLRTTREDLPDARRVKGSLAILDVLRAAIADRQELPTEPVPIELSDITVDLDSALVAAARDKARATGRRHNEARAVFRGAVLVALAERAVDKIGQGWLSEDAEEAEEEDDGQYTGEAGYEDTGDGLDVRADLVADVRAELRVHPALRSALAGLWPTLTPERLLSDLFTSRQRLRTAAPADQDVLFRTDGDAWTVSDVPLLDEATELLGRDDRVAERLAKQRAAAEREYAEGVLGILDTDEDPDGELLRAVDVLDPDRLADRHVERDTRALAERAVEDREWAYGHLVVDEAQELSDMDWRVLVRRCPSRSMTVVGDLAQRRSVAGARTWAEVFEPYVSDRWVYRELTVNYRMPAELMAVAAGVLAEIDPTLRPPTSLRHNGAQPWAHHVDADMLLGEVTRALTREQALVGPGSVAVIVPEGSMITGPSVLTPKAAKGLEFDSVIVVEPGHIRRAHEQGASDLYVALTRATQRLGVLHSEPLPPALAAEFRAAGE